MTFITVSATVAIALAYQAFCSSAYEFCSVRPDLLLGGLLTIAASCASVVAVAAALTVGMVVESISLDPPLSHTLSYMLAVWFIGRAQSTRRLNHGGALALAIGFATALATGVRYAVVFVDSGVSTLPGWMLGSGEVAYAGLVNVLVVTALHPIQKRLRDGAGATRGPFRTRAKGSLA